MKGYNSPRMASHDCMPTYLSRLGSESKAAGYTPSLYEATIVLGLGHNRSRP